MVINIIRFLFLFFLYFSNASTILSIYPILYILIKFTEDEIKWYYFGLAFSVYEIGKLISIPLWGRMFNNKSKMINIFISLFFIFLLNISFCFISKLFHILIIRFLLGFSNYIGQYFKSIYIQMGFKKNKTIIIFFISIINTAIALFLPSIIIDFDLGNKIFNVKNIHMKNIKLTYGCIALSNLLAIFFGAILICKNKHRIETGFYQMNSSEKPENSIESGIKTPKTNIVEIGNKSRSKIIKSNNPTFDTNINIIPQNKISNDTDAGINKSEKSDNNNINDIDKKNNIYNIYKNNDLYIKSKEIQFCLVQTLINLLDGLSLIWTLIILYIQFQIKCFTISLYISIIKILGEIIIFPINDAITKNSTILLPSSLNLILKKLRIINIFLLLISVCVSQIIFSLYYYSKYNNILMIILFLPLFIRTVLNGISTQLFKIYNDKFFKQNNVKAKRLKLYNQYSGSLSKAIIYIIGSFSLVMIEIIISKNNIIEIIIFLIYFHLIPLLFYIILIIAYFRYFN